MMMMIQWTNSDISQRRKLSIYRSRLKTETALMPTNRIHKSIRKHENECKTERALSEAGCVRETIRRSLKIELLISRRCKKKPQSKMPVSQLRMLC